jgi:spermidine synthase
MKPTIVTLEGHKIMIVDNVPISVSPPPLSGYWNEMVPDFEPKNVLILGLGGGTVATLIKDKYPKAKILGVDNNREIINLAKKEMGLPRSVKVLIKNVFEYVYLTPDKFDFIVIDIWEGGLFDTKVFAPDFMAGVKKLLNDGGKIYVNAPNLDVIAEKAGFGEKTEIHTNSIYKL